MSPHQLALRTLLLGRPRSVLTVLLIAACLCLLSLFAGNIASTRARLEYQAVTGERLGHLSISRARDARGATAFDPADAERVKKLAETVAGVAQVVPQMRVSGIASTGERSALFHGEGIGSAGAGPRHGAEPDPLGKLNLAQANGIALSSGHARALGLRAGANLTLTGVTVDAPAAPLKAEVVDIFGTAEFNDGARSVLMPFEMAQSLLATERTERLVVYLADPRQLDAVRVALRGVLHNAGLAVDVHSWQELSPSYIKARSASDLTFDSIAGMVFAAIAAAVAATISMNAFERRREVATLRAFGMHSSGVFLMFAAEALWMAAFAVVVSLVGSGLIAWVVNRAALSYGTQQTLKQAPMLVELDFHRMLMAVVTVMAVALLAALAPAFKAARGEVAENLAA
ncbi:MAG TPA: ABC transporter permease [Telluria sp.]|nr:ABC transporter permease [Telluria sp.]